MLKSSKWQILKGYSLMALPAAVVVILAIPVGFISGLGAGQMALISALLMGQNISFTIVSRARQMTSLRFHAIAAVGSNGFYIFVFSALVANYSSLSLKLWYVVCTVVGSVSAHYVSLHHIEKTKSLSKGAMVSRTDLDLAISGVEERLRKEFNESTQEVKPTTPILADTFRAN